MCSVLRGPSCVPVWLEVGAAPIAQVVGMEKVSAPCNQFTRVHPRSFLSLVLQHKVEQVKSVLFWGEGGWLIQARQSLFWSGDFQS